MIAVSDAEIAYEPTEEEQREAFLQALEEEAGIEHADRADLDVYLDHLLERLREREEKVSETNSVAQRRKDIIDRWAEMQNASLNREAGWLRLQIQAVAQGYDFGGKKSRTLPNGSFGYRRTQDTVEIIDKDLAIQSAEALGIPVKVTKELQKTPVKEHLKAGGTLPDGVVYVMGAETFFVKAG